MVNHNPVRNCAKMTDQKIEKLVNLYDASGVKLPVLETIRSNECTPVLTKQQESILNLHERLFASVRNTSFDISYYIYQLDESTKLQYSNLVDLSDKKFEIIEKKELDCKVKMLSGLDKGSTESQHLLSEHSVVPVNV